MEPIWKDYTVVLASSAVATGVLYRVITSYGVLLFQGRAYPRPGASNVVARINDIVAAQLVRAFDPDDDTAALTVSVQTYNSGTNSWATVDTVTFYADWSYDPGFDIDEDDLNAPLFDAFTAGQRIPCSTKNTGTVTFTVEEGGEIEVEEDNDYPCGAVWVDLQDYPLATDVSVNGRNYERLPGCHRFVLYYVNAFGGWDFLVIQGKTEQFDDVTHYVTEQVYDNSRTYARGKRNYVNELQHRYVFHTQWMGLEASLKMHHLLNSPLVLCHDVQRDIIRPVVLTNSETEYKHGGRLYQYTIEAALAQNRERR